MSVEASTRTLSMTAAPNDAGRPDETVGRLTAALLVLALAWIALPEVGAYETYWARLIAVALALVAWWAPSLAAFGLAVAALIPVAVTNPGVAVLALAAFTLFLLVFPEGSQALTLVLATPVFLYLGMGPAPVFLLLALGEVRRGPWASAGLLMSLALVVAAGQAWAGGYLSWGLSGAGPPIVQLPVAGHSWDGIVERLMATQWEDVLPQSQAVAMTLARMVLDHPLIPAQVLVWLVAPALGLVVRRSVLQRTEAARRGIPPRRATGLFADVAALLVASFALVLGHLLAAPLFTIEPVTPEYESAVINNAVWSLLLTSGVVAGTQLSARLSSARHR